MAEWWTYSLADFLMFSPRAYYRLFELYNVAVWPAQVLTLALGAAILALLTKSCAQQGRVVAGLLAAFWLWIAWAYFLERYDTINWAGSYIAAGFAVEALVLVWLGISRSSRRAGQDAVGRAGLAILLFALVAQPVLAPLLGRPWTQAEVFGVAPDPTAIGTLGTLLASGERVPWGALAVPLLWCLMSGATLWTMGAPDAWVPILAAVLALVLAAWKSLRRQRHDVRAVGTP